MLPKRQLTVHNHDHNFGSIPGIHLIASRLFSVGRQHPVDALYLRPSPSHKCEIKSQEKMCSYVTASLSPNELSPLTRPEAISFWILSSA